MIIRDENDLDAAIERVMAGEWDEREGLRFDGYPRFEITLQGERFDGGVPTRIMPALVELQRAVDKPARQVLGKSDPDIRRRTEITVRTERGSTSFISDTTYVAKRWIDNRRDVALADVQQRINEQDAVKLQAIEKLITSSNGATQVAESLDKLVSMLTRQMVPTDELSIQGEPLLDGAAAKRLRRRQPQPEPVEDRLDGEFLILSVESGAVSNGIRATVRNTHADEEMSVNIPGGTLAPEQIEQLKAGEWDKKPLNMQINVSRVGNRIRRAVLISAGVAPTGATDPDGRN